MAKKVKKEKQEGCSLFEEMLMWTSYRYCIGRHSYVVTMADDIAGHYYDKLSDTQKLHATEDIRRCIGDNLRYSHLNLEINRWYNEDEYNPLSALFEFINRENIASLEELAQYCDIEYNVNKNEYRFSKRTPVLREYNSIMDIDDLVPWENLASLFDIKKHKRVLLTNGEEDYVFPCWTRKTVPVDDKMDSNGPMIYYKEKFGWERIWRPVSKAKLGNFNYHVPNESIVKFIEEDDVE